MLPEDYPEHAREYSVEEYSLDELAKGLARGTLTRGRMLKLAGAALLGGVISAAIPGVADARKKKKRTRCTSCLITSSMPSGICCLTSSGGTSGCLVPSSFCASAPSGTECTCSGCSSSDCSSFFNCNAVGNCQCACTTEGGSICFNIGESCLDLEPCTSTADCPAGRTCVVDDGCANTSAGSCVQPCPTGGTLDPRCPGPGNCSAFPACNEPETCECQCTTEGGTICVDITESCLNLQPCIKTADCPEGRTCVVDDGCANTPAGSCVRPCPA